MRKNKHKPLKGSPPRRHSYSRASRKRIPIWWPTAAKLLIAIAGVLIAIIVASVKLGYWSGRMDQKVEEIEKRIDEVEQK